MSRSAEVIGALRADTIDEAEARRRVAGGGAEDVARVELAIAHRGGDRAGAAAAAAQAWEAGARDRTVAAAIVAYASEDHPLRAAALAVVAASVAAAHDVTASVAAAAVGVATAPADPVAWAQLVRGLIALGDIRSAIEGLQAAVADGLLGGEAWLVLAVELCNGGRITEARAVVDRLASASSSPDLAAVAALVRLAAGDPDAAEQAQARGEALNPGAPLVWVAAHAIALVRDDRERADRAARRAVALGVAPEALRLLQWQVTVTASA